MNKELQQKQIQDEAHSQRSMRGSTVVIILIMVVVIITLIGYIYNLQNQLNQFREETRRLDSKINDMELGQIATPSVRQLAENLDLVISQQQNNFDANQQAINYMTITFTIIGLIFILVSGYFIYGQQKSEDREDEGWNLAKNLLELITDSQRFVVQVQTELKKQQEDQKIRDERIRDQLVNTVRFLNDKAKVRVTRFARDTVSGRMEFARLVDISNRIDSLRFQLPAYDLTLEPNCYFLKAVYEYIIGNYNSSKREFDGLIRDREDRVLENITEKKQLSLCYYYRGLIDYNIQDDLIKAGEFMDLAVQTDPQINGPDFKSLILRAEINFKLQKSYAFVQYKEIAEQLKQIKNPTKTQNRLLSHAYLGMVHCRVLEGGKKFLPSYYGAISKQLGDETILDVVNWLHESSDSHIYTLLTLAQLAVVFEEAKREVEGFEPSGEYFQKTFEALEESKSYEVKEESRAKILGYSVKLVCEKSLGKSTDTTERNLENLLNDQELQTIYSIFSKANVSKVEYRSELKEFGALFL